MIKARILGMGNDGNFNYIIVKKNKDFFQWLSKLLGDAFGYQDEFVVYDELKNKKGTYFTRKRNIKNYIDKHQHFQDNDFRIDLFYGKKGVFMTIVTPLIKRKKLMRSLEKNSVWKIPKIKNKIKKVIKKI